MALVMAVNKRKKERKHQRAIAKLISDAVSITSYRGNQMEPKYIYIKGNQRQELHNAVMRLISKKEKYGLSEKDLNFLWSIEGYLVQKRARMISQKQLKWIFNILDKHEPKKDQHTLEPPW